MRAAEAAASRLALLLAQQGTEAIGADIFPAASVGPAPTLAVKKMGRPPRSAHDHHVSRKLRNCCIEETNIYLNIYILRMYENGFTRIRLNGEAGVKRGFKNPCPLRRRR